MGGEAFGNCVGEEAQVIVAVGILSDAAWTYDVHLRCDLVARPEPGGGDQGDDLVGVVVHEGLGIANGELLEGVPDAIVRPGLGKVVARPPRTRCPGPRSCPRRRQWPGRPPRDRRRHPPSRRCRVPPTAPSPTRLRQRGDQSRPGRHHGAAPTCRSPHCARRDPRGDSPRRLSVARARLRSRPAGTRSRAGGHR